MKGTARWAGTWLGTLAVGFLAAAMPAPSLPVEGVHGAARTESGALTSASASLDTDGAPMGYVSVGLGSLVLAGSLEQLVFPYRGFEFYCLHADVDPAVAGGEQAGINFYIRDSGLFGATPDLVGYRATENQDCEDWPEPPLWEFASEGNFVNFYVGEIH